MKHSAAPSTFSARCSKAPLLLWAMAWSGSALTDLSRQRTTSSSMSPVGDIPGGAPRRKDVMTRRHHTLVNGGECGSPRNGGARRRLVNRNDTLPDTSLEGVFAEFYRLKRGLGDHPGDETYTGHATIMPVTVVENVLRVRMLPRTNAMADYWKVTLRVPLLVDAAWGSGGGLAGRGHVKAVSGYLESIGKDGSAARVCLGAGDIDRFVDAACPKPEPCLKNTIPASSYTFQKEVQHYRVVRTDRHTGVTTGTARS